jgi:predicted enzyme related to lactoylglutathione lyase
MSERTDYPSGAPCWVETLQPDPDAAAQFYGQLFGWQFDEPKPMPGRLGGEYLAARIAGRLVAGIGQAPASAPTALWSTCISVDGIEAALTRVAGAGGAVIVGPLQAGPDGRLAVVTDPAGVAFGLWQPAERIGAQLVNEPGTWAMSALHTPSPERARSFYGLRLAARVDICIDQHVRPRGAIRRGRSDYGQLIVVDEADRLSPTAFEHLRDRFDRRHLGLLLIGMPGLEKRLAVFPQLYSRIGFAHKYQPLTDDIASVAYWYQSEPHAPFPDFPPMSERWGR